MKTWNGVEVVEIDGGYYALDGWNGEIYGDCWRVRQMEGAESFETDESDDKKYEVKPIYEEKDGDFEEVGYELY